MHPNVKLKKSFIDYNRRRNVLFLGHKSAGKATTIQKIALKEISRLRDSGLAGKDRNKYERVEGKETVKFGSLKFETESFRYDLLKAPSHHYYTPGLMSKAKQADIAVVILSGLETDVDVGMKGVQTADCTHMVMSLGITKVLLVVNKADDSGWCESRFEKMKSTMLNIWKSYGFRDNDLECIPMSSKDDLNIHKRTGRGPSLFDALDGFQVGAPAHGTSTFVEKFGEKDRRLKFIRDLIKVDLCLDVNNVHAASWYQRALLLEADDQYLSCEALFESAKKAADNGFVVPTEENNNLVYSLIEGYRSLANKDFNRSVIQFSMVSISFAKKNNSNAVTCLKTILEKINEEWREETKGKSSVESAEPGNKKEKEKAKNVTKTDIPSVTSQVVDVLTSQDYDVDEVVSSILSKKEARNEKEKLRKQMQMQNDIASGTSCTSHGENAKPEEYVVPHAEDVKQEQYDSTIASSSSSVRTRFIEIPSASRYKIELSEEERSVYDGTKFVNGMEFPQCFIACSEPQIQNYKALVLLGSNDARVLSVGDVIEAPLGNKISTFFAVESVKVIDTFFSEVRSEWHKVVEDKVVEDRSLARWWHFIEPKFKKIFRGVIDGLLYLHSKNRSCGNLFGVNYHAIYITADEQVRILPSMDSGITIQDDINGLLKCMKGILNLPFNYNSLPLNMLPKDLYHLLTFIHHDKLNHVPSWWVLDHFIFWTPQECVDFIFKVRDWQKRNRKTMFEKTLRKQMYKDHQMSWPSQIPLEGVFREIFKKGDPNRPQLPYPIETLKSQGIFQVASYNGESHILRYMVSVYTHYNDTEYNSHRNEVLDAVDIEHQLRQFFPDIYGQLVKTLYICARWKYIVNRDVDWLTLCRWRVRDLFGTQVQEL